MDRKSTGIATQKFIESIEVVDTAKYQILIKLREIVFEFYPDVKEKMMYGGIIFSNETDWGGIFVYQNHISFEFSEGYKFNDPENLLEGKGKFRRHLKFKTLNDIQTKKLGTFVKQTKDISS